MCWSQRLGQARSGTGVRLEVGIQACVKSTLSRSSPRTLQFGWRVPLLVGGPGGVADHVTDEDRGALSETVQVVTAAPADAVIRKGHGER